MSAELPKSRIEECHIMLWQPYITPGHVSGVNPLSEEKIRLNRKHNMVHLCCPLLLIIKMEVICTRALMDAGGQASAHWSMIIHMFKNDQPVINRCVWVLRFICGDVQHHPQLPEVLCWGIHTHWNINFDIQRDLATSHCCENSVGFHHELWSDEVYKGLYVATLRAIISWAALRAAAEKKICKCVLETNSRGGWRTQVKSILVFLYVIGIPKKHSEYFIDPWRESINMICKTDIITQMFNSFHEYMYRCINIRSVFRLQQIRPTGLCPPLLVEPFTTGFPNRFIPVMESNYFLWYCTEVQICATHVLLEYYIWVL